MSHVSMLIVGCGVLAIIYGIYAIRSVLDSPVGTKKMQEIVSAQIENFLVIIWK